MRDLPTPLVLSATKVLGVERFDLLIKDFDSVLVDGGLVPDEVKEELYHIQLASFILGAITVLNSESNFNKGRKVK